MTDAKNGIQGEGDKESDRKYRERTRRFLESEKGRNAIKRAGQVTEKEARELKKSEEKGKARAKGEDPQVRYQSKR